MEKRPEGWDASIGGQGARHEMFGGAVQAHMPKSIDPEKVRRVFMLSSRWERERERQARLRKSPSCPPTTTFETPFGRGCARFYASGPTSQMIRQAAERGLSKTLKEHYKKLEKEAAKRKRVRPKTAFIVAAFVVVAAAYAVLHI